ncbi:MAG: SGNH/GDSL hydrolase family protein [Candidatus Omnitrophica bacterium]|nr:SGNH/GDSL hydrolase family protein [Candidatus Omnitrophota bacterium]
MKIRNILQNILMLGFSLIFALVVLEIALRIIPRGEDRRMEREQKSLRRDNEYAFYEYDRVLGWKNKPLAEGKFRMPDSTTYVKINSKGLRDEEYPYEKSPDKVRILVLGDSFVWGYGVEKEEIFTERLETMLGPKFESLNAGVSGYGTDQELLFLENEGIKYKPDIILLAFASNDFMFDNRKDKLGYYPKPLFIMKDDTLELTNVPLPDLKRDKWKALEEQRSKELERVSLSQKSPRKKGIKGFLKSHTRTYPFLSRAIKNLKYSLLRKMKSCPVTAKAIGKLRSSSDGGSEELDVTKAILLRMNNLANKIGAKLVIFIIPYKCALEKLPNPYIAEFIEFFKENDIPSNYPYESYLGKIQKGEKLYLNYDDHWNPAGHQLAAEEIYLFLKKKNLVKAK